MKHAPPHVRRVDVHPASIRELFDLAQVCLERGSGTLL